jgi:hypothetical protein
VVDVLLRGLRRVSIVVTPAERGYTAVEKVMARICVTRRGCWEWPGATNDAGYGQIRWLGKTLYIHRVVWEHHHGVISAGLELDHLCRNTRCCNPEHLEAVPHRTNVLRGESPSAHAARRDNCPACGAPKDGTYTTKGRPVRYCKSCNRRRSREHV